MRTVFFWRVARASAASSLVVSSGLLLSHAAVDQGNRTPPGAPAKTSATLNTSARSVSGRTGIQWEQIGVKAGADYHGDGLTVVATAGGAWLHCVFQRLDGAATREGLWLFSAVGNETNESFRVTAAEVGRQAANYKSAPPISGIQLPLTGEVTVNGQTVRFERPGLAEEYSVGVEGVRQDFVVTEKRAGAGELVVQLEVTGATAEAMVDGARLVLGESGRKIAYSRLRAEDAKGRELPARMEVRSRHRLMVAIDDAAAEYPLRIDPTFSDANWFSLGGLPGTSGSVSASVVDGNGHLFIGGTFSIVGNAVAANLAEWDGSSWSALGSGMNNSVLALAVSGTNLYAGGTFTNAGGVAANRIAKWNGSSWSALASGMNAASPTSAQVLALAVLDTNLFAGGVFTNAGGITATNIAEWNGTAWSALSSGVNSTVNALAVSGTNLYAGGAFTTAGGALNTFISRWNGTAWSPLGTGMNNTVYALAVSGNTLYAGGAFYLAGGISATNIAQWNGTWSPLGTGMNNLVNSLAVSGGTLFAGGSFTNAGGMAAANIAQWNGSLWSALGSGVSSGAGFFSQVTTLAASGSSVFAGGIFTSAGGLPANDLAQWNGSSWSAMGSGMNNTVWTLKLSGTNLYAGGTFTSAGAIAVNRVAQWNGNFWSPLGSGMNAQVTALALLGTNLYAGGFFTNAGGVAANDIAQWNGSSWLTLSTGMNGGVTALAVLDTNLVAAGSFTTAGGVAATNIAQWNGSSWTPLGLGIKGPFVQSLAVSGSNLFVGGTFTAAGGVAATNIAQWNGSSWSALGSGMNASVTALAATETILYAGGSFVDAGGVAANRVAQWNGSSWSALGLGMDSFVAALAVSGTNLYAGGSFANAGGVAANRVAQWDGSSWSALGSGMNQTVNALAVSGSALYAGGSFTTAGGKVSAYAAGAVFDAGDWLTIQANVPGKHSNTMTYAGFPTSPYVVQFTTNLLTGPWVRLTTNTPALNGIGTVLDPSAVDSQRFYELIRP